jgi:hypothetical protein
LSLKHLNSDQFIESIPVSFGKLVCVNLVDEPRERDIVLVGIMNKHSLSIGQGKAGKKIMRRFMEWWFRKILLYQSQIPIKKVILFPVLCYNEEKLEQNHEGIIQRYF